KNDSTVVIWLVIEVVGENLRDPPGRLPPSRLPDRVRLGESAGGFLVVRIGVWYPRWVRSSRTLQPILQSVTRAYLPQFVEHTPCRRQTNRFGLATDCTCNTPHQGEATRTS